MDARLERIDEQRLRNLRRTDLPALAAAIVAFNGNRAQASSDITRNIRYVRFLGEGVDVIVLWQDWEKVLPYVESGYFSPFVYPTTTGTSTVPDKALYDRVLAVLQSLFTRDFPA